MDANARKSHRVANRRLAARSHDFSHYPTRPLAERPADITKLLLTRSGQCPIRPVTDLPRSRLILTPSWADINRAAQQGQFTVSYRLFPGFRRLLTALPPRSPRRAAFGA
jgi:hypothetical protein